MLHDLLGESVVELPKDGKVCSRITDYNMIVDLVHFFDASQTTESKCTCSFFQMWTYILLSVNCVLWVVGHRLHKMVISTSGHSLHTHGDIWRSAFAIVTIVEQRNGPRRLRNSDDDDNIWSENICSSKTCSICLQRFSVWRDHTPILEYIFKKTQQIKTVVCCLWICLMWTQFGACGM